MVKATERPKIILLGPPGSGKSTVCRNLSNELGLVHIAPGELLKQNIKRGSDIGTRASISIKESRIVPDNVGILYILKFFTIK